MFPLLQLNVRHLYAAICIGYLGFRCFSSLSCIGAAEKMAGGDRISALPLELKISILSLLDIKDILRTSVLSRSWRHVWTHLHDLAFCNSSTENNITALRCVDHVLSSLRVPIFHFSLILHSGGTPEEAKSKSASIQRFLQIIFEKGELCDLCINNTSGFMVQFRLPQFDSLKKLHLCRCEIQLPHDFKGFRCLTNLTLDYVSVSEKDIQLLINRSRNLTTARLLLTPTEPISVTISAPLLTELQCRISDSVKSCEVVFAPCLQEVHIVGGGFVDFNDHVARTMRFMASIASASSLTLCFFVLLSFSLVGVPETYPLTVQFHQLKCLRLYGQIAITNKMIYNTFIGLLKSGPFIERLEIEYDGDGSGLFEPILWDECKKQDGISCLDQTLKSVKIIVKTFNFAMNLLMPHFILVNATVLKLMEIKYHKCSVSELKLMDGLHKIKPVSLDVKLVIGPSHEK